MHFSWRVFHLLAALHLIKASILLKKPLSSKSSPDCGGTISGSGVINYKVGEHYDPNERCVWTIINDRHDLVTLDLLTSNFAESGDHLEIFYRDGENGLLKNPVASSPPHCDGPIMSNQGALCRLNSSLVFIVFRSNEVVQGTGFSLKVEPTGQSYPPQGVYEGYTLREEEGALDYNGSFGESNKVISWTLIYPNDFVLYNFNMTTPKPCISPGTTPSLSIYQVSKGSPHLLEKVCGGIEQPLQLIQGPNVVEPFIVMFQGGPKHYFKGDLKFYWNLEEPPTSWVPEPGSASQFTGTTFILMCTFYTLFLL